MSTSYMDSVNTKAGPDASARSPMAAVLTSRPYQLLWTAQFASLLAGFFNYIAVSWLALQLTGSTVAVGAVLAAASIPMAVLMLGSGVASDRFTPRATMIAAGLIRGALVAIIAGLTIAGAIQLWELIAAAVVVGATTAFFIPAGQAMLPRIVSGQQLQAGNAVLNLSRTGAMVLGSAAAGVVVAAIGAGAALAVDAAASVFAALVLVPLPAGDRSPRTAARSALADIREGIDYVWRDVPLRVTLIGIAVINLAALGAIEVGLPALAFQRFGESSGVLGAAFAAWGIGSTVGAIAAGVRPAPTRVGRFLLASVVLTGAGIGAIGLAPTLPILVVVMILNGIVEGASTTVLLTWLQRRTDPALQGRAMSLAMFASTGLEPLALAAAGAIAASGLGLLFWGATAVIELTAGGAASRRSIREL
ncbi:MAG TPA: MFS transporter [Candidatus Limnocylindrales bacterium]|nr:MFS transporter [Candidatus Limnocylindrales bacterium]